MVCASRRRGGSCSCRRLQQRPIQSSTPKRKRAAEAEAAAKKKAVDLTAKLKGTEADGKETYDRLTFDLAEGREGTGGREEESGRSDGEIEGHRGGRQGDDRLPAE